MAEKKNGRRNGRPATTAEVTNGKGTNGHQDLGDNALTATVVREMTESNTELAKAAMGADAVDAPVKARAVGFGGANVSADGSNVTDEASQTAVAFGDFVKNVGMAVASAQEQLDQTLRLTAKQLSEQKIEVAHTFEQVLDDEGKLTNQGQAKLQALPLINYIMPTAYQWSRVYLEANMTVQEFNSKSGFDIQSKSKSGGLSLRGGFGVGGFSGGGFGGFGGSSSQTSVQNGYAMDSAAGTMRMEATLEPRADIELPKPIILQRGPTVAVTITKIEDIKETNPPEGQTAKTIGKLATLKVVVKNGEGQPNKGKTIDYSVGQPQINHSATTLTTNDSGEVTITLRREGAAYDPTVAMPVEVVCWLGLVSKTVTVNM